ncbi:MAG: hypothetical protein E6R03_10295 [Hyphomicrobiaceae bacterium]|nr:MAG: hypothetical protein E6R03_10295 [Hyphomicrobiaceae bacterium]
MASLVCEEAGLGEAEIPLILNYINLMYEDTVLFGKKHHDYGTGNISATGEVGVLFRASDKLARLFNFLNKKLENGGVVKAVNESIDDAWADLRNYAGIARTIRAGEWPNVPKGFIL